MRFENLFRVSLIITFLVAVASVSHSKEQCEAVFGNGPHTFSLSTGSPGELGLLRVLGEAFSEETDTTLCWIKAGSGDALRLLKGKKVDMVLVHAPDAEKKAVAEGWATKRTLIGYNEFYIVGPSDDPARISEAKSAVEAYARIAKRKEKFFSRGDNSGTHKKEMEIWKRSGISPSGDWYIITKDFMVASLKRAGLEKGYFMTDNIAHGLSRRVIYHI